MILLDNNSIIFTALPTIHTTIAAQAGGALVGPGGSVSTRNDSHCQSAAGAGYLECGRR